MKSFVALSCLLAVASASWIPQLAVLQPQHLPIIGPNGVPLEPAANVAARAQHAAAVVEAQARNGDLSVVGPAGILGLNGLAGLNGLVGLSGLGLVAGPGLLAQTVIGPNGVPLEPAANVAARIQHAQAVAEAQARNGDGLQIINGAGIALANGVPVEPLANQIARAQHAAAVAQAHGRKRRSILIGANGVPVEPLANQIARAQHAQAVALAQSGLILTPGALGLGLVPASHTVPAIGADGQPIKTPEVQILEARHAQAHAEARARNVGASGLLLNGGLISLNGLAGLPIIANGVPLDTPEVQAARAAHLVAKAAALQGAWA